MSRISFGLIQTNVEKRTSSVARLALRELRQAYRFITSSREAALRRQLNAIKWEQFSRMLSIPKCVPQQAIKNRGAAFEQFFGKQAR